MATEGIKFEPPAQSRDEDILYTTLQGKLYEEEAESRIEDLLKQLNESIVSGGGGFTPTEEQLAAMNSGITETDVEQISTNKNNILLKANTSDVNTATANLQSQINNLITPVTQDAEVQNARVDANGVSYNTLKSRLDYSQSEVELGIGILKLDYLKHNNGHLTNDGKWDNINSSYQHVVVSINAFDKISINTGTNQLRIGFLTAYTTPVDGASVSYSTVPFYSTLKLLSVSTHYDFLCPSDAHYIVIETIYSNNKCYPNNFVINNYDYGITLSNNIAPQQIEKDIKKSIFDVGFILPLMWERGAVNQSVNDNYNTFASNVRQRTNCIVTSEIPYKLYNDGTYTAKIVYYTDNFVVDEVTDFTTDDVVIPANKKFVIVIANASDTSANISAITSNEINSHICIKNDYLMPKKTVSWCAMGDSITEGYVSYINSGSPTSSKQPSKAWVTKVAFKNNWNITNIAIGGTGWLYPSNSVAAWELAKNTDFSTYNLITLGYGVNDWKSNQVIGTLTDSTDVDTPTTVIQAMKMTIEAILEDNPFCKIFVITPINCVGYNFGFGDFESNYGLGFRFSNSGTLEEFTQALISVCDYYGIEYIDMTHYSCVNRKNILNCLTDGVHPNATTYEMMSKELARKIVFK